MLDCERTLHQVEIQALHTRQALQLAADQAFLRRAVHLGDAQPCSDCLQVLPLGLHAYGNERLLDRLRGGQRMLHTQHPLHQVEVQSSHAWFLPQAVANQRFLRWAIHVLDPVRHALSGRHRRSRAGRQWLWRRGLDEWPSSHRRRETGGQFLGTHADGSQNLLYLRARFGEVLHRQSALGQVEVQVLDPLNRAKVRADEFLFVRTVHVFDAVGGQHRRISQGLRLHAHGVQRMLQVLGPDQAVRNGQLALRKIELQPLDAGHTLQRALHKRFLVAAVHVAHMQNRALGAGLFPGAVRLLAIAVRAATWIGRVIVHG